MITTSRPGGHVSNGDRDVARPDQRRVIAQRQRRLVLWHSGIRALGKSDASRAHPEAFCADP
jgi:hypothetical protein